MNTILKRTLPALALVLFLTSCIQEEKVRRYTFVLNDFTSDIGDFQDVPAPLSLDVFKLKEKTFMVMDVPKDYDFATVLETLKKQNAKLHDLLQSTLPLERVYKLEQQNEYSQMEGQLISIAKETRRHVLTLEIINDALLKQEYRRVHAMGMAWPQITRNMEQMGIKDMEIYMDGYQAYLIMDTRKDFDLAKDGEKWSRLPREAEWQEYVSKFQKVDPKSKAIEKWQTMTNINLDQTYFKESWESLKKYEIPQWMKDSKFGIFIHWGPNSVAELHTDWYSRWMYLDEGHVDHVTGKKVDDIPHAASVYHKKKFGDPKEFGFKDLIPMWTMENFDAKSWVDLFKDAGAQYVVPVAEHHDGYALYGSSITPYNAVDLGPKRDVFKELTDEIKKQGLLCGASSHLAFNWNFYTQKPHFDTGDPRYADLYAPPHEPYAPASKEWLANTWWPRTKEIIDKYQPDILWFDFYLDRPEFAPYHKKLAAYYYNSGLERNRTVVLQTKNLRYESFKPGTHMLDLERSKMDSLRREYWQTDTSIGKNSWYYAKNWIPKSAGGLIADLMDIVSKNGCMLLNIGPRKDGIIPDDQKETLLEIGAWLQRNGEAVYGSKYFEVYGEGPTKTETGHLSEGRNKGFTQEDIRFTTNGDALYATVLAPPTKDIKINYLTISKMDIKSIELLGYDGDITFEQTEEGTSISLPEATNLKYAWVFKIKNN